MIETPIYDALARPFIRSARGVEIVTESPRLAHKKVGHGTHVEDGKHVKTMLVGCEAGYFGGPPSQWRPRTDFTRASAGTEPCLVCFSEDETDEWDD